MFYGESIDNLQSVHEHSDNEFYQLFLYVERSLGDPYSAVETIS